jgi:hypothetical protein
MYYDTNKVTMTNKCTSSTGHFMATAVRRSNTDGIAQCGMSRATLEATGCRHQATTHSLLPQQPPGQQQMKQGQKNVPKRLAISMAAAVRQYNTAHNAR